MASSTPSTAEFVPLTAGPKSTAEFQPLEIILKEMQTALGVISTLLGEAEAFAADGRPEKADDRRRDARAVADIFRSRTVRPKDIVRMLDMIPAQNAMQTAADFVTVLYPDVSPTAKWDDLCEVAVHSERETYSLRRGE